MVAERDYVLLESEKKEKLGKFLLLGQSIAISDIPEKKSIVRAIIHVSPITESVLTK